MDQFYSAHSLLILHFEEKCGPEETDRDSSTIQAREHMARSVVGNFEEISAKRKTALAEKPKLDNARKLRGIYHIRKTRNSTKPSKKCAKEVGSAGGLCNAVHIAKDLRNSSLPALEDPQEKTRDEQWQGEKRKQTRLKANIMRITHCRRGFNSMSYYNLVHKPTPLPEAIKIPDAKAAVDKS